MDKTGEYYVKENKPDSDKYIFFPMCVCVCICLGLCVCVSLSKSLNLNVCMIN